MHDPEFIARLEALVKSKQPPPAHYRLALGNDAIFAVGYIALQWAALYETILHQIARWKRHPAVPEDLRRSPPDLRQSTNITYLQNIGKYVLAGEREGAVGLYTRNLAHVFSFKADRDKLAHGIYALQDNEGFDGIVGIYNNKKFHLSAKRLRAVGEGIARCNGFFFEFGSWLNAETHLVLHRSLLENLAEQDRPR